MEQTPLTDNPRLIPAIFVGWHNYQHLLTSALAGLTPEQLALGAAPGLRTIGHDAAHIIAARASWFNGLLEEGDAEFAALRTWDDPGQPERGAAELVSGLAATWDVMQAAIARWRPEEWAQTYPDEPVPITRQWVIWHLIEHDLHHGGEISLMLGMHGLRAPDL